ncbi:MAG: hypothetical protein FWF34_00170 [Alphaproteobacteria bacterium]|nr:hypothetical protein [Alphaproteobacteria bacterium]MCL2889664.1 hypothetical protein [Alphaproteobacteria bacterium]
MQKPHLVFLSGLSGSGKGWFCEHVMPDVFYKLKSMTTRPMRDGEKDGREYYFVDEADFYNTPRATTLFVNEHIWKCGMPKWLYGVPESEFAQNPGKHLVYDVIEPKYIKQMMDWVKINEMEYECKIFHFQPPKNNYDIANARANMPNDLAVRQMNTCDLSDFWRVGLNPDYSLISSNDEIFYPDRLMAYLYNLCISAPGQIDINAEHEKLGSIEDKLQIQKIGNQIFRTRIKGQ